MADTVATGPTHVDPEAGAGTPPDPELDPHAICIRQVAEGLGIQTDTRVFPNANGTPKRWLMMRLAGVTWYVRRGTWRVDAGGVPGEHVNGAAADLMLDKTATKALLAGAGIPVPTGRVFPPDGAWGAIAYAAGLGRPVCVKPNAGRRGALVFPGCATPDAVADAFARVARRHEDVLVEESLPGEVVRHFYVRPHAIAVKLSRPASVVADGSATVASLIEAKNSERERRAVPGHHPIVIDRDLVATLGAQRLKLDSVPAAGRRVMLRRVSNGAFGADSLECADDIHPSYARQVEAACAAVPGVRISAIDMKVLDRRSPAASRNHWILELNGSPGILPYHHPWEGRPQDVVGAILHHLGAGA